MDTDIIITNISRHRGNESRYNEEIHKKQSKINQNNRNIMDYRNKITKTKSLTTIKSYYNKIATFENNNTKLQKEVGNLQKKAMAEQKEINRLEKQLLNANNSSNNSNIILEDDINMVDDFIVEKDNIHKTYSDSINDFCKLIKKQGLKTHYGLISNIKDPGNQGGNGKILFGELNKHEVAIKVLYNNERNKINRFFDEFVNVFMTLQKEKGIVELYLYETYKFEGVEIHYIIMKKYNGNLLKNKPEVNERNTIKLFLDLCNIIKKIHEVNIIHRDIKPENILIDENNDIVLCDFGIAFFNPEEYEYTGHTLYKEVLGNRKFSAPEQANRGTVPHVTMDIYALGQIMQWFVIGDTHSGTGRKTLNTVLNKRLIYGLDQIIDKCLRSDPKERYQSMEELYMDIDKFGIKLIEKLKEETIDDFFKDDYEVEQDGLGRGEKIVVI